MELWASAYSAPRGIVKSAKVAEAGGWTGLSVVDSQNLSGDAFVAEFSNSENINRVQRISVEHYPAADGGVLAELRQGRRVPRRGGAHHAERRARPSVLRGPGRARQRPPVEIRPAGYVRLGLVNAING